MVFGFCKIQTGSSDLVPDLPVSGNVEIYVKVLQETVVIIRRSGIQFRLYGDAIYNTWSIGNITIHQFSKYCSIIETSLFIKVLLFIGAFFWSIMT